MLDDDYFRRLGRSEFVLCPNGDYLWSYRFFEAVLCGAIPIIENWTDVYAGFVCIPMDDSPSRLIADRAVVRRNFEHAADLLTVPLTDLEQAVTLSMT